MITRRKIRVITIILLLGGISFARIHAQAVEPPSFSLTVQQDHDKAGGNLDSVSVQVKNLSGHNIGIVHDLGDLRGQQRFRLKLKAGDGAEMVRRVDVLRPPPPPNENPLKIREYKMSVSSEPVKPVETLTRTIDLEEVYMLPDPGDYTLEVSRWDLFSKSYITATPLHVTLHGTSCRTAFALCTPSTRQ